MKEQLIFVVCVMEFELGLFVVGVEIWYLVINYLICLKKSNCFWIYKEFLKWFKFILIYNMY